ncbi:hypothetical protein BTVI_83936 [Pitangus sulphuratus]|nr:hypothetical protein BTVI_83936 [Pitangus sulphuratus]
MLHLYWGNPLDQYRLGDKQIKSNPAKKDSEVMVDERLDMSCQCVLAAQKANRVLDCIQSSVTSRSWEGILPLYSALLRPHLEYCIQIWESQHRDMNLLEEVHRRATEMIRGMEHFCYKEKTERIGIVQPEEKQALGRAC